MQSIVAGPVIVTINGSNGLSESQVSHGVLAVGQTMPLGEQPLLFVTGGIRQLALFSLAVEALRLAENKAIKTSLCRSERG